MNGRIIRIDNDKIVIRPSENFLDIEIDQKHQNTDGLTLGDNVEIDLTTRSVLVKINGVNYYGRLEDISNG